MTQRKYLLWSDGYKVEIAPGDMAEFFPAPREMVDGSLEFPELVKEGEL